MVVTQQTCALDPESGLKLIFSSGFKVQSLGFRFQDLGLHCLDYSFGFKDRLFVVFFSRGCRFEVSDTFFA